MNDETLKAIREVLVGDKFVMDEALDRIAEIVDADRPRMTVEQYSEFKNMIESLAAIDCKDSETLAHHYLKVSIMPFLNAILDGKGK